jgi:hypothetical protein
MNMVVRSQMTVTARVGSNVTITDAKAVSSNISKPIKQCPKNKVRLLELQKRIQRRFDISIILNFFNYIYFFPFSGMSSWILI